MEGNVDELLPKDPSKPGLYWHWHAGKREWNHFWWNANCAAWGSISGAIISPRELARQGYSDPRYIPTTDETALLATDAAKASVGFDAREIRKHTPDTATLDDRQAPVWTLKEPGVLVHRDGRHAVEWQLEWAWFVAKFRAGPAYQSTKIGSYPTPEAAKAAAERHAAWCKEFGYE